MELKLLTDYIGMWGWRITGLIFLNNIFLSIFLNVKIYWIIAFTIIALICFIISFKRKSEIEDELEK